MLRVFVFHARRGSLRRALAAIQKKHGGCSNASGNEQDRERNGENQASIRGLCGLNRRRWTECRLRRVGTDGRLNRARNGRSHLGIRLLGVRLLGVGLLRITLWGVGLLGITLLVITLLGHRPLVHDMRATQGIWISRWGMHWVLHG